jgi:hypothetical protein
LATATYLGEFYDSILDLNLLANWIFEAMKEYSFDPLPGYPVPRLDHIPGMIERHDLYIKDNGQTDIVSICRNYQLPPSAAKMLHEKLYRFIHYYLN